MWISYWRNVSPDEEAHQGRNMEEAMRAFETVLLLDLSHREAKMCMAASLSHFTISRVDEARDYYRQLLESEVQDNWALVAGQALEHSFTYQSPISRAQWFEAALRQSSNSPAGAFYHRMLEKAEGDVLIKQGPSQKVEELA